MTLTELDTVAVRSSFDRAAEQYDSHAVLQHEVESRLLERLEHTVQEPDRILDIGCGTGSASNAMAGEYPQASVIGLDWSKAMLRQMKKTQMLEANPVGMCADMHAIPLAANSVNVVFSNLAMQWTTDLEMLLTNIRTVLKPGGMFLFSSFGPDTLHELRSAWATVDDQPHVNRFVDMHDIGDRVVAAGFVEPVFDIDFITLEYRDVIALMRDLKAIGAHNSAQGRSSGLTGKDKFSRVINAYEQFRQGDIYPATYEVIYGVAFGPGEGQPFRHPEGEMATFSIDALKASRKGKTG
ncbi:MAG: malonyl-CoA O-methyltransferase [Lysobacterales bacterium]|jgi:malonyl-CoA O-methyltransferase